MAKKKKSSSKKGKRRVGGRGKPLKIVSRRAVKSKSSKRKIVKGSAKKQYKGKKGK